MTQRNSKEALRVILGQPPRQTMVSYPMIGLTGLLHLVAVVVSVGRRPWQRKEVCRPLSSPPPPRGPRCGLIKTDTSIRVLQ